MPLGTPDVNRNPFDRLLQKANLLRAGKFVQKPDPEAQKVYLWAEDFTIQPVYEPMFDLSRPGRGEPQHADYALTSFDFPRTNQLSGF
jgi:hypothetical protein